MNKKVLIVSPFFSPNIGGVESHLDDLIREINRHKIGAIVSTYKPLTTKVSYKKYEKTGSVDIYRFPWFGHNWFHILEKVPFLTLIYLFPGLFIQTLWLLFKNRQIRIIHAHGFIAALVVKVCNVFFHKKTIISTHALYSLQNRSILAGLFVWILSGFDTVFTLSEKSRIELVSAGVPKTIIKSYTYWVDQNRFKPAQTEQVRRKLGWKNIPTFLFVGRLIRIKGILLFLKLAESIKTDRIQFAVIGSGPEESEVNKRLIKLPNLIFVRNIPNKLISDYYNAGDVLVVPSQYEEGMARVVMEAISSGLFVLSSNRGCLPEMIKSDIVGKLINPEVSDFQESVSETLKNIAKISQNKNLRKKYAVKHFSNSNVQVIMDLYK